MPSTKGSFQPKDWTQISHIADGFLSTEAPGKTKNTRVDRLSLLQGIFLTQESSQGLLYCRESHYQLNYQGSPPSRGLSCSLAWEFFLHFHRQQCGIFQTPTPFSSSPGLLIWFLPFSFTLRLIQITQDKISSCFLT